MKREEKENLVKELKEAFDKNDSFYLIDFLGMSVAHAVELRRRFRDNACSFRVIKNRLVLRALKEDFPEDLKSYFQGPTAIAFAPQDPIKLAQIIQDFSSKYSLLKVKGGLLEGQFFPEERFVEITSIQSREDLMAKIGYLMAFPLIKLSTTWQAPLSSLSRLLSQLRTKNRVGGKNAQSTNKRSE